MTREIKYRHYYIFIKKIEGKKEDDYVIMAYALLIGTTVYTYRLNKSGRRHTKLLLLLYKK